MHVGFGVKYDDKRYEETEMVVRRRCVCCKQVCIDRKKRGLEGKYIVNRSVSNYNH